MKGCFDLVIAGAGPAGTAAAITAARAGRSVALVDRRPFPRPKLCGGLLTAKTVQALQRIFGLDPAGLTKAGVLDFSSDRYSILHGERTVAEGTAPHPFLFVKRLALDDLLLRLAVQAGVTFLPGRAVTECRPETGEVAMAGGDALQGRFVIGADGVGSVVRRSVPHDARAWRRGLAAAIEAHLPRRALCLTVDHPMLFIGSPRAGYGWAFPNSDGVVVGVCGLMRLNADFPGLFRSFLKNLGHADPESVPLRGHPLPYGNHMERPWHQSVLLAGDAAGFVDPLFGEGIFYALLTGCHAAQAVCSAMDGGPEPGPAYGARLRSMVFPEFRAADRLRWTLFGLLGVFGPSAISAFVRTAPTRLVEAVHGLRSYSLLREKSWD